MKIKIGKYTWNSKKCIPLQVLKYGVIGAVAYLLVIGIYFVLVPISTLG